MCRLPRARVEALIAGDSGALCTDCVPLALAVLDGGPPGPRARTALRTSLQLITQDLGPRTLRAESSGLFAAAVALHPEPELLRIIAHHAFRVSNPAAALEALNRIPDEQRTAADRISASAALSELERYTEARTELERLGLASLEPTSRGLALTNLAWFMLKLNPGLSGEELARVRAQAEEGYQLLVQNAPPEDMGYYRLHLAGTRAALAIQAREPAVALQLLADAEAAAGMLNAAEWLLRGDARAALDGTAGAREAWERAVEVGHPEAIFVREARERLVRSA